MNRQKKNIDNIVKIVLTVCIGVLLLVIGNNKEQIGKIFGEDTKDVNQTSVNVEKTSFEKVNIKTGNEVISKITDETGQKIYFFDVGQADSILIVNNGKTMLIDGGNNEDGDMLVKYINTLGISKIDILVGTHPHEDHIGGLDNIIKAFDTGKIYMPKVQTNTKTFEEVLDAISDKGLKVTTPSIGDTFKIGDANCEIMSIGTDKSNLNSTSIVIRMVYKDVSYLFTGDMEKENEDKRTWPKTDILKVAHHGSKTSSSAKFLNQIMPKIAVIQVGKDNSYGHPHNETLKRLEKLGVEVYRNDLKQTILIEQK